VTGTGGMDRDAGSAIEVRGVGFAYDQRSEPVISGVSLDVHRGERLGILGPNGGGKSTLLRLLLGELTPTSGEVRVLGESPRAARSAGRVGYVPQRVTAELGFPLSVRQVVEQAVAVRVAPWRGLGREARARVARSLELVGAADLASRPIGRLSGGQRQRVLIARAVAAEPEVLLLDEPTVGIDVAGQQRFGAMLDTLRTELGLTVVVVSHELATIAATSDRVACLRRSLHFHDSPHGLTPEVLAELFSHDVAVISGHAHVHACGDEGCPHGRGTA
jgi:zinc transport system ATP-binding protein